MLPVVALVGRPNVGKSTLFNRLTRSRDALVAETPGLTRDRHYGEAVIDGRRAIVVDTGGIGEAQGGSERRLTELMAEQADAAVAEADIVLLICDAREGLTPDDENAAARLRRAGAKVIPVVNKVDGLDPIVAGAEFHALALGEPSPISGEHGHGVRRLSERLRAMLDELCPESDAEEGGESAFQGMRLAVVGRPNVGKSTLINRLYGEDRLLAYDEPGTTRDSIEVPLERDGRHFVLVDTAGLRRRARVREPVEKFSAVKALQAIDAANCVIVVLDASEGVVDQDTHIVGEVIERGRALVLAVNKWDGLTTAQRSWTRRELDRRFGFVGFAERVFMAALHGTGIQDVIDAAVRAYDAATRELSTHELTEVLHNAVAAHQPPLVRGRTAKLRYAHAGGNNPPTIIVHGNRTETVPESYRRYLENTFRQRFGLIGTPINIVLRSGRNPYAGRSNTLSRRQLDKRRRLKRFTNRKH